ncbi:MAG: DODA-type extradiol aromatic ring-opening family dioxygenase [Zoogloea sp.]|uniref:DODA-type extradiol aromatic ring-opening family dioxygenase n=1 Tax=Zoogloea sp. TaxID=49181 RepID=UPI003F305AF5
MSRLPTYFISHGGGPWPWMQDGYAAAYEKLAAALGRMPAEIEGPIRAVLMISAHWEAPEFSVMTHPQPEMLYDYYGFPEHTYQIRYPAPGDPALAEAVATRLEAAGFPVARDARRGYDHGTFTPMAVIFPEARMPIVQLSLKAGLDPATHMALGRALAPLRDEQILILGSGLSYHNLRAFGPQARAPSAAFDQWLAETLALEDASARRQRLCDWAQAPAARFAHPREEHLLPLMVALGAAESGVARRVYHQTDFRGGVTVSSYRFD